MAEEKDVIKLNEKVVSRDELEDKRKEVAKRKDVRLVEVAPNEFKTEIRG